MIPPQGNADFAAAMEKVLDVYRRPYDAAFPVVCMDETPRHVDPRDVRADPRASRTAGAPRLRVRALRHVHVFMAAEPLAGKRMTKVTERKTKIDWARFLGDIAARYEDAARITLVMTISTRIGPARPARPSAGTGQDAVGPLRVRLHPQARQLAERGRNRTQLMIRQCLNRRIDCIEALRREVAAWQASRDSIQAKVDWQFTTDDARVRLKRLYPTLHVDKTLGRAFARRVPTPGVSTANGDAVAAVRPGETLDRKFRVGDIRPLSVAAGLAAARLPGRRAG